MNYAWTTGRLIPAAEKGVRFTNVNFTQKKPHTAIFAGIDGLIFIGCNLTNCDMPPDAMKIDCVSGHVEYCANIHPRLVERGLLTAEPVNCSHVVGTDTIRVADVTVDIVYYYADKVVS